MRSQPAIERISLLRLIQHLRSKFVDPRFGNFFFFHFDHFLGRFLSGPGLFCHCRGSAASAANVLLWVYRWVCYLPGKVRMADKGRASSRTLSVTF